MKPKARLFLKSVFNKIFWHKESKNTLLRLLKRDYELSQKELQAKVCEPNPHTKKGNFILSLTSFPARIHTLKYTLYSIFAQDLYPKKIVLSLSACEFDMQNLPSELEKFESWGIEILWNNENIRQYSKIIPVLRAYPNEIIVTIDDDIFYPHGLLRALWEAHLCGEKTIWTHRARAIKYDSREIKSFSTWRLIKKQESKPKPSCKLFLEGVGGVLYPPHSLHSDVLDSAKFMRIAPKADDAWLWAMAVLGGSVIGVVENNLMADGNMMTISPYNSALWSDNLASGNDNQIKALLREYPCILEILHKGSA